MKKTRYTTAIVKKVDKKFIKEWQDLWKKAEHATLYNSYEWFNAVMNIAEKKEYEIHVCHKGNTLVAVLPLQKYKVYGVPVWGILSKERLGDTPFLLEKYDKTLMKHFFGNVFKRGNIFLQKMDNNAAKLLHELFPDMMLSLMSVNPTVYFNPDPLATASQSLITQVNRLMKKYEGKLRFEMHRTHLKEHYKEMLILQKETSKTARSMDIFQEEANKQYYKSLIDHCKKLVRISFLYFENRPIAYEYGLLYKDHYVGEQIAYHNDFKRLSPGKLMVFSLIRTLQKEKVAELDQGGGISEYKTLFTKNYRLLYNCYASQNVFIRLWWKLVNSARRMNQKLFPKKYTRDHEFLFKTL